MVETVVRACGLFAGALYAAIALWALTLVGSDESGEFLSTVGIVTPGLVAALVFLFGVAVWYGPRARLTRLLSWCVLVVGVVPLVSFSFLLIPALVVAIPCLRQWPEPT